MCLRLCLVVVSLPHRKPVYLSTSTALGMTNYDITIVETFTRNTMVLCEAARARRGQHAHSVFMHTRPEQRSQAAVSLSNCVFICLSVSVSLSYFLSLTLTPSVLSFHPPSFLCPSLPLSLCFSVSPWPMRWNAGMEVEWAAISWKQRLFS